MSYMSANTPWPNKTMSGQSNIKRFRQTLSNVFKEYYVAKEHLIYTSKTFYSISEILPDECDDFLNALCELRKIINDINHVLGKSDRIPEKFVSRRYSFLFHLYRADEISNDMIPLVQAFRRICLETTPEVIRLRQQIIAKLGKLSDAIESAEPESKILI